MSYFLYISFYVVLRNVFSLSSTFLFYIYIGLSKLTNLKRLDIAYNDITLLELNIMENLTNLEYLSVENNSIVSVQGLKVMTLMLYKGLFVQGLNESPVNASPCEHSTYHAMPCHAMPRHAIP